MSCRVSLNKDVSVKKTQKTPRRESELALNKARVVE